MRWGVPGGRQRTSRALAGSLWASRAASGHSAAAGLPAAAAGLGRPAHPDCEPPDPSSGLPRHVISHASPSHQIQALALNTTSLATNLCPRRWEVQYTSRLGLQGGTWRANSKRDCERVGWAFHIEGLGCGAKPGSVVKPGGGLACSSTHIAGDRLSGKSVAHDRC